MTASVCGVLRQPAKGGEIAALAPCILGLGVGGEVSPAFSRIVTSLPSTKTVDSPVACGGEISMLFSVQSLDLC